MLLTRHREGRAIEYSHDRDKQLSPSGGATEGAYMVGHQALTNRDKPGLGVGDGQRIVGPSAWES